MTERVRVEDALKHLLNCELASETPSLVGLAGSLETSRGRAHELVGRLVAMGLVQSTAQGIRLSNSGRAYALRVLRTHRLLERFFADRTGVRPTEWHDLAEVGEHALTEAEVDDLALKLGDPLVDPHGDPIPTAEGRLPAAHGLSLGALEAGAAATVVHLEDEPEAVFRRLVSIGFSPAVPVKLLSREEGGLVVLVGGREVRLDPLEAAAVTVEPVPEVDGHTVLFERLDSLRPGERAEIVQIAPAVQGSQRRRLLDLGVIPGTEVTAEIRSPAGDPVAYRIRGALIALRRPQAQGIYIRRVHDSVPAGGPPHQGAAA
jgi:DtxR family Mn-dependent transcriptional regulator